MMTQEQEIRMLLSKGSPDLKVKVIYRPAGGDRAVVQIMGMMFYVDAVRRIVNAGCDVSCEGRKSQLPHIKTQRDVTNYFNKFPKITAADLPL